MTLTFLILLLICDGSPSVAASEIDLREHDHHVLVQSMVVRTASVPYAKDELEESAVLFPSSDWVSFSSSVPGAISPSE